jgi:hypothetical protein
LSERPEHKKAMPAPQSSCPIWPFIVTLVVAAFGLNWLWEMVQMPAYAEMAGRSWRETAPRCTVATLGDVAVTLAIYAVGALAAGRLRWGMKGAWNVYVTGAILGGASAVAIEWRVLGSGRWSYSERMPIVPGTGIGLWPLLQLTLLVPLTFWIAARWAGSFNSTSALRREGVDKP